MIYEFYKNNVFQAALKVDMETAKEYVQILRDATYSMWTAKRVK